MAQVKFYAVLYVILMLAAFRAEASADLPEAESVRTVTDPALLDSEPAFKGGDLEKFQRWFRGKVRKPSCCRRRDTRGNVKVAFVVGADGQVRDAKVVDAVCDRLGEACVKALYKSPVWRPGIMDGEPVAVKYTFTTYFDNNVIDLWLDFMYIF